MTEDYQDNTFADFIDMDSPEDISQQQEQQLPDLKDEIPEKDRFIIDNIELFDEFAKELLQFSFRPLVRDQGILTQEGPDDFAKKFDKSFGKFPNGVRKQKIKKLLKEHPSLRSVNPDVMWYRITYFIKKYPCWLNNSLFSLFISFFLDAIN